MRSRLFIPLLAAITLAVATGALSACPGCKDALAAMDNAKKTPFDPDPAAAAEMFSWTVLLMLGTMLGIGGSFVGSFYWMIRRSAAQVARDKGSANAAAVDRA